MRGTVGGAIEVDLGACQARHRDSGRHVLEPAHAGSRTEIAPALPRPADHQLEQRIIAQRVIVVGILFAAGDPEHGESEHRRERVRYRRWVSQLPGAADQRIGEPESAFARAQQDQAALRRDLTSSKTAVTNLRLTASKSNPSRLYCVLVGATLLLFLWHQL